MLLSLGLMLGISFSEVELPAAEEFADNNVIEIMQEPSMQVIASMAGITGLKILIFK